MEALLWIEVKDGKFMERAFSVCKEENSSEKGFRIRREGHFIEKCFKMYSTTCSEFYGNRFYSRSMCFRN